MAIGISIGIGIPSGILNSNATLASGAEPVAYYYSGDGLGQVNLELNNEGLPILNDSNIKAAVNAYLSGQLEDIELWDVSNVTNMGGLFLWATQFNQDISNWDVSSVTDMSDMFSFAKSFNQPIGNWDVSNVTNMSSMFRSSDFNQDISNWDVSNVTNMRYMFGSSDFNQDITQWNVSNVTNMKYMFTLNTSFNQPIGDWDVSSVIDMGSMFEQASSFNQPIGDWDTSSLTDVSFMFANASSFNQPIGDWDVTNFNSESIIRYFMSSVTLSTPNYDNLLIGWAATMLNVYPGGSGYTIAPSWNFGNSVHTIGGDAETAKNTLVNTFNWTITDAN